MVKSIPSKVQDIRNNQRYASINWYINYLQHFERDTKTVPGQFYAYQYMFTKDKLIHHGDSYTPTTNPNMVDISYDKIKFYDFWPMTYVFHVNPKNKTFFGLNFHHLPLNIRLFWLKRIQSMFKNQFSKEDQLRIPMISYDAVKHIGNDKIAMACTRQYRNDRVMNLRKVPLDELEKAMSYYSKTYYGVNISQIENKYRLARI
jgi:hypothetical protein